MYWQLLGRMLARNVDLEENAHAPQPTHAHPPSKAIQKGQQVLPRALQQPTSNGPFHRLFRSVSFDLEYFAAVTGCIVGRAGLTASCECAREFCDGRGSCGWAWSILQYSGTTTPSSLSECGSRPGLAWFPRRWPTGPCLQARESFGQNLPQSSGASHGPFGPKNTPQTPPRPTLTTVGVGVQFTNALGSRMARVTEGS